MTRWLPVASLMPISACALAAVALGACSLESTSTSTASLPRLQVSELPPTPGAREQVWVLSAVGLNVRASPDAASSRVATLHQASRLDVLDSRAVSSATWLRVRTHGSGEVEGWVLDQPDLLIHRAVSQHIDSDAGWSMLFPEGWTLAAGNPATFTSPPTETPGGRLSVQTATDLDKLSTAPSTPGRQLHQESPVEVYGKTTFLTVYGLDAGGFEYAVRLQLASPHRAFLFLYRQGSGSPDTSFFKQLLDSVILSLGPA